jgi:alkyl hydroperoxide reductase subunit AhpC
VSALSEANDEFEAAGAVVLEVSVDDVQKQADWSESMGGIKFHILSDADPKGRVSELYGILSQRNTSRRATFIIDKAGVIQESKIYPPGSLPSVRKLIPVIEGLK